MAYRRKKNNPIISTARAGEQWTFCQCKELELLFLILFLKEQILCTQGS